MKKWLKNHGNTREGQERQITWNDLQTNSNVVWCDDHVDAIKNLKEVRNPLAHPKKINLTQARQEVPQNNSQPGKRMSGHHLHGGEAEQFDDAR